MWESNQFIADISRKQFIENVFKGCCIIAMGGLSRRVGAGSRSLHDARFFKSLSGKNVQCKLCFRQCVITPEETGYCGIRKNVDGALKTFSYGNPAAIQIDPIEKKPFFHFLPGSKTYSLAEIGCNINCKFCQNWRIAHAEPGELRTHEASPDKIAQESSKFDCPVLAFTYSEPTVWTEYVIDCAAAAREKGIRSTVISNGTWSPEALKKLSETVDAVKVDLKSIEPDYYRKVCDGELKPVLDNIVRIRESGIWLELVNLVVTGLNDGERDFKKLASWVKENVGEDVPVHFTRFQPLYKLKNLSPTPLAKLDSAYHAAKEAGLNHVYVGNVPGHPAQNTVCSRCGKEVVQRTGFLVKVNAIRKGKCPECGVTIPGIWS